MVRERINELTNDSTKLNSLTIELLSGCNLKCVHCYVQDRMKFQENNILPLEIVYNILEQAEKLNVFYLTITGGEPLLHPDIYKILERAKAKSFIVTLKTNGTLINSANISLLKKYVYFINLSCYGFTKETYEKVTKTNGSFDKYLSALELLQENCLKYDIRGILLKENQEEVENFIESCSLVETYISDHINEKYASIHRPDNETVKKVLRSKIDKEYFTNSLESKKVCNACVGALTINCKGDVNPCTNFHLFMGNIYNDPLESIWNSDMKNSIIRKTEKQYFVQCQECEDNKYNIRMAPCNNYEETGNMNMCSNEACRQCQLVKQAIVEM